MRDRVFLQRRVTVVAILFPSVLTARALFHMNEDPMRVLMLNPPPPPPLEKPDPYSRMRSTTRHKKKIDAVFQSSGDLS